MKRYLFAFLILLLASPSFAANHYIRDGASGDGSDWTNAWDDLPSTLVRGDTYYIADGNYGGYTFDDADSGATYIYIKKATASAHGTDTGWSSAYGDGQAVFTGQWLIRTNYLDIDGVTGGGPTNWEGPHGIKKLVSPYSTKPANRGVYFDTGGKGNYVNFKHIEMAFTEIPPDTYPSGECSGENNCNNWEGALVVSWYGSNPVNISYSWLHLSTGAGQISLVPSGSGWTVEYSKLGDNYGNSAQHGEIIGLGAGSGSGLILRYNYFYKWRSSGGVTCLGDGNTMQNVSIYGNIFDHTETTTEAWYTIACGWGDSYGLIPSNWKIYNNTFINYRHGTYLAAFRPGGSGNEMENNIFWYSSGTGPRQVDMIFDGSTKQVTNDYNWYTGDTYYSSYGEANGINGGSVNPFVNTSTQDFRLIYGIAGLSLSSPYNYDMLGILRNGDTIFDRGAFEYESQEDVEPPGINNSTPGSLPSGITQTTISWSTTEVATCRWSQSPGVAYDNMVHVATGGWNTSHSAIVGSTILSDNFNRANENPLGNGNWTKAGTNTGAMKIVSNAVTGNDNSSLNAANYSGASLADDQCSTMTVNGDSTGPIVRVQSGQSYLTGYALIEDESIPARAIVRFNGDGSGDFIDYVSGGFNPGDVIKICIDGKTITTFLGGSPIADLTLDDSTYIKGSPGVYTYYTASSGDDWSAFGASSALADGNSYTYNIRCSDGIGNKNLSDYPISFTVQSGGSGVRTLGSFTLQGAMQ